jgi:hypothetical protein
VLGLAGEPAVNLPCHAHTTAVPRTSGRFVNHNHRITAGAPNTKVEWAAERPVVAAHIQEHIIRYSIRSFALASETVCHCILLGESLPPRLRGDDVVHDVAWAGAGGLSSRWARLKVLELASRGRRTGGGYGSTTLGLCLIARFATGRCAALAAAGHAGDNDDEGQNPDHALTIGSFSGEFRVGDTHSGPSNGDTPLRRVNSSYRGW